MYCFVMRPSVLPKELLKFMHVTGPVSTTMVQLVQQHVAQVPVPPANIQAFLNARQSPVQYRCRHAHPRVHESSAGNRISILHRIIFKTSLCIVMHPHASIHDGHGLLVATSISIDPSIVLHIYIYIYNLVSSLSVW